MYMDLYGLREQPFGVTPNPRFLYFSSMHKSAMTALVNSVCERRGFSALIAKPGMGKTSLLMQLLSMLRDSARTGFLFQTHGSTQEFLSALLQDIEAPPASTDLVDMQKALNAAVMREARANRQLVIVVDEAQNLSDDTLESIRLLSNFENPEAKLLHIIFAGQPPLSEKLASPQLAQLRQRLSVVAHLSPLTREQVTEYVSRRLQVAGYSGQPLFAPEALDFIAYASEGIPRNINNLCFHALSLGYASRMNVLDLATVQRAARALDLKAGPQFHASTPTPPRNPEPCINQEPRFSPEFRSFPSKVQSRVSHRRDPLGSVQQNSVRKKEWPKLKIGMGAFACTAVLIFLFRASVFPPEILAYLPHGDSRSVSNTNHSSPPSLKQDAVKPTPIAPSAAPLNLDSANASPQPTVPVQIGANTPEQPRDAQAAQKSATDGSRIVHAEPTDDVEQLTRRYFGPHTGDVLPIVLKMNPGIASPPAALPAGTPVMIPAVSGTIATTGLHAAGKAAKVNHPLASNRNASQVPVRVEVQHPETIFQFAMEHYGKADIDTVENIRAANPQIKDIYQTLREGQALTLPGKSQSTD